MEKKTYFTWSILFIILIVSFVLRLLPLQQSHWWDETVYLQNAETIFSGRTNYDEFNLRPPVLPILFSIGYIFAHNIYTPAIIVSLLGTIGVFFTYLIGKELYDFKTGLIVAIFFGLSPFMVTASHWIMTDIPSITFIIISFYAIIKAVKKKSTFLFAFSGIIFGISILTRFTSLMLGFIIPAYIIQKGLLINKKKSILLKQLIVFLAGAFGILAPYLIWSQVRYGFFLQTFINANNAVSDLNEGTLFYIFNFGKIYPAAILFGLVIYLISAIYQHKKNQLTQKKDIQNDLILLLWAIGFLTYASLTAHKEIRYIIPICLPVYLLSSKGYNFLINHNKKTVQYLGLLSLVALSLFSFSANIEKLTSPIYNSQKTEQIIISEQINSAAYREDIIYTNADYPVYAYYTGLKTIRIFNRDSGFYNEFNKSMVSKGFFIFYKYDGGEPNIEWIYSNNRFNKLYETKNIILYRYLPLEPI